MRRIAAIYAILVGVLMIGQWAMFIVTGQVPEFNTEPIRITFHLAGEFTTAALLVAGGLVLLTERRWGSTYSCCPWACSCTRSSSAPDTSPNWASGSSS